jgi:cysteine-rich repeat protein
MFHRLAVIFSVLSVSLTARAQNFPDAGFVTRVPASTRLDADRDGQLDAPSIGPNRHPGFCALWAQSSQALFSLAEARVVLDETSPKTSIHGVTFLRDLMPSVNFEAVLPQFQCPFQLQIPWSIGCTSAGSGTPIGAGVGVAARLRGNLHIETAGTYTFLIFSNDGSSLSIGDQVVSQFDGPRQGGDSRRARFEAPGVYPIEIRFFDLGGGGVLSINIAPFEQCFDSMSAPGPCGGEFGDISSGTLPAFATYVTLGFETLDSRRVAPATWASSEDRCTAFIAQPNRLCTARSELACGNGVVEFVADGGVEGCDDGNLVNGDGCSSTCILQTGFWCGPPQVSVCRPLVPPVITSPIADGVTGPWPDFSGTGLYGMTIEVTVDGRQVCTATVDSTDRWRCTGSSDLAAGAHVAQATQGSNAAVSSLSSGSVQFTVKLPDMPPDAGATPPDAGEPNAVPAPRFFQVGCACNTGVDALALVGALLWTRIGRRLNKR